MEVVTLLGWGLEDVSLIQSCLGLTLADLATRVVTTLGTHTGTRLNQQGLVAEMCAQE